MNRWIRLWSAFVGMVMIGNLQYAWTLFAQPMVKAHAQQHWQLSDVQWGFGLFIAVGTWAMPFLAPYIDKAGPRPLMALSGVLCAIGWGSLGHVETLPAFYSLYSMAGIGVACVYACGVATAVKWFPDRRGIASGLITAGYGMGAAAFNPLFDSLIRKIGYADTFLWTGITHGAVILLSGLVLMNPPAGYKVAAAAAAKPKVRRHDLDFNSAEMIRTPQFYFLYIAMLSIGIGGLMVTAQLKPVATNFKIGAAAVTVALVLTPLANGSSRILWGSLSDYLGREWAMFTAFSLQAIFLVAATTLGRGGDAIWVVLMVLVFLTWGELYALFPAVLGDLYGSKNSALNYSFLYSAKGVAALVGSGIAAQLFEKTGTWNYAFFGSAGLALLSALMALYVRKMPLPQKRSMPFSVQPSEQTQLPPGTRIGAQQGD
ncbi:MAG: oxalate/formate MFS antiporter [Bryobacterales bacterium]|nr:oxalate/formate MFS antiporter [Bryobacterales bacterium]MBV9401531.1 oxalate/formate MFS antiporter [Bryobacterales bacterium]